MWIINEVRKDILIIGTFLIGSISLTYLIQGVFEFSFFYYMLNIVIAIMSIGVTMLMKDAEYVKINTMFKLLAASYKYIAISIIAMIIIRDHYGNYDRLYIHFRGALDVFEIVCLILAYKYFDKTFELIHKRLISILFFLMMFYVFFISNTLGLSVNQIGIAICIIEGIIVVLILCLSFLNVFLSKKLDKRIIYRIYVFLGFKLLYHLLYIFYVCGALKIDYLFFIILRCIYTYYLMFAIFYQRILIPWDKMVQAMRIAQERLEDNEKDRSSIINLSHELKTPINVIQSASDILSLDLKKEKDEEFAEYISYIKKIGYLSTQLITNVIDNNKLTEGYLEPKYTVCNLVTFLDCIVMALVSYQPKWYILSDFEEEEIGVYIDEELMQRSILNLIILLISYQTIPTTIYIDVKLLKDNVWISIKSPKTKLPNDYQDQESYHYNADNINEMSSFEFTKRVMQLHGIQFYSIYTGEESTAFYLKLKRTALEIDEAQMIFVDEQEQIDLIIGKLKMCYIDILSKGEKDGYY